MIEQETNALHSLIKMEMQQTQHLSHVWSVARQQGSRMDNIKGLMMRAGGIIICFMDEYQLMARQNN